jgi:hypothetical protein
MDNPDSQRARVRHGFKGEEVDGQPVIAQWHFVGEPCSLCSRDMATTLATTAAPEAPRGGAGNYDMESKMDTVPWVEVD